VIVSVAAALAVLGAILAFALVGEENPGGSGTAGDARAASSGSRTDAADSAAEEPSASGQQQEAPPTGQRSAPATEPGTKEEGGEATAPPDGFAEVTDSRFHFTMALPEGWQRSGIAGQNSGGIYSESGGVPRVQVDFTATPGPDAVAAWRDQERSVRTSIPGYRSLGIEKVEYRGYPTVADWSFERDLNGQRVQVLNRGFRVDSSHGYAIMITCAKDAWPDKECERLRETAFTTFRPAD
jgi:hypothetical protein